MTELELASVLVGLAALFGVVTYFALRLPQTIGLVVIAVRFVTHGSIVGGLRLRPSTASTATRAKRHDLSGRSGLIQTRCCPAKPGAVQYPPTPP